MKRKEKREWIIENWEKPTVQLSIRLPKGIYADLVKYAEENHLTLTRVITTFLVKTLYSELTAERIEKELSGLKKEISELRKELSRRDK